MQYRIEITLSTNKCLINGFLPIGCVKCGGIRDLIMALCLKHKIKLEPVMPFQSISLFACTDEAKESYPGLVSKVFET